MDLRLLELRGKRTVEGFYYIFEEGERGGEFERRLYVWSFFLNSHVSLVPQPPANGHLGL